MEVTREVLAAKFGAVFPHLDERQRRRLLGAEARSLGHGGIRLVAGAAGVSEVTVSRGVAEWEAGGEPLGRVRRPGGGRKRAADLDLGLVPALLALVEPEERGDRVSPLRWTVKSTRTLAAELTRQGHQVSADTVGDLLREQGFSLQGNAKTVEGRRHPDRDAQFRYINEQARAHQGSGDPVISVDAKKKEQVGEFANAGRQWRPRGQPARVRSHDFPGDGRGRAIPSGVYDVMANTGWVNVGTDHDTAAFAVESIRRWWHGTGAADYPAARRLLITADAGGSNSYRARAWKAGLAALAAETGLQVTCCHFPPGTSKWNKIEHRLFSHITLNWRGRPLTSHQVIVASIAATTTATGLTVRAGLGPAACHTGIKISDAQMAALPLDRHHWHGDWNYTLHPQATTSPPPPQAPPPRPRRAGACQATLTSPALTGVPRHELDHLAAALALPFAAAQEARLYQQRGGPRRRPGTPGPRPAFDLTSQLAITLIHQHTSLPQHVLAWLTTTHPDRIRQAIKTITPLLAHHHAPTTPPPVRLRTPDDLIRYATKAGIALPPDLKPAC